MVEVGLSLLLATLEALSQAEGLKAFVKLSRVGNKAFLAQSCSNSHRHFLALTEYGGFGQRGYIVIQKAEKVRVGEALCLSCDRH